MVGLEKVSTGDFDSRSPLPLLRHDVDTPGAFVFLEKLKMHESRWMRQTRAKIRVGPEYQAVLPDLQNPKGKTEDQSETGPGRPEKPRSSPSAGNGVTTSGQQGHGPKNNKPSTSEDKSSQVNMAPVSESNSKTKSSTKTHKTISKTKTNNKGGPKSSK